MALFPVCGHPSQGHGLEVLDSGFSRCEAPAPVEEVTFLHSLVLTFQGLSLARGGFPPGWKCLCVSPWLTGSRRLSVSSEVRLRWPRGGWFPLLPPRCHWRCSLIAPTHSRPKVIAVVSDITLDAVGITEMRKTQSPPTRGDPTRAGTPTERSALLPAGPPVLLSHGVTARLTDPRPRWLPFRASCVSACGVFKILPFYFDEAPVICISVWGQAVSHCFPGMPTDVHGLI